MTIREWWNARSRNADENDARLAAATRRRGVSAARGLRDLSDDELIAGAEVRTGLSRPYHEMEMQRPLKESLKELTAETAKARWWAFWGSLAIGALTLVLVALTIVLALKA